MALNDQAGAAKCACRISATLPDATLAKHKEKPYSRHLQHSQHHSSSSTNAVPMHHPSCTSSDYFQTFLPLDPTAAMDGNVPPFPQQEHMQSQQPQHHHTESSPQSYESSGTMTPAKDSDSKDNPGSSTFPSGAPYYYPNTCMPNSNNHYPALKLEIPAYSSQTSATSSASSTSPNSVSSLSKFDSSPPASTSYTELTPLPSPLVPTDSTSAIFKAFNGQSPPTAAICRAPSMRSTNLRFNLRQPNKPVAVPIPATTFSPVLAPERTAEEDNSIAPLPLDSAKVVSIPSASSPEKSVSLNTGAYNSHINLQAAVMPHQYEDLLQSPSSAPIPVKSPIISRHFPHKTGSRSVSEYVPQPLIPSAMVSYHHRPAHRSGLGTNHEEADAEPAKSGGAVLKDRTNEQAIISPPLSAPSDEIQNPKRRAAPKLLMDPIKDLGGEEASKLIAHKQPILVAPQAGKPVSDDQQEPTAANQAHHKVQPRSASSGSPTYGRTIQREKPVASSKPEPPLGAASSSSSSSSSISTLNARTIPILEPGTRPSTTLKTQDPGTDKHQPAGVLQAPPNASLPFSPSLPTSAPSTSATPPQSSSTSTSTSTLAVDAPKNTVTLHTASSEKGASLQSPQESTSSATTASTSSGSISSSTSIATASSSIATSATSTDKFFSERVYEAYDINMKKSTWNEIKQLGRGAFSRVILACPADRYLRPEYQGRSGEFQVAIKVVDIQIEGGHVHSRERMESGLKREIEILKVR